MECTTAIQITPPSDQLNIQNRASPSSTCSSLLHLTLWNVSHEKISKNISPSSGETSSDGGVNSQTNHQKMMPLITAGNKILSGSGSSEQTNTVEKNSETPPPNPFEIGIEERLHLSAYSPTIFSVIETPTKDDKPFRWSIDQLAKIYPVDIDVMTNLDQCSSKFDQEKEKKAQEAINAFFSQPHIAPSPWLQPHQVPARPISFSPCMSSTAYMKQSEVNGESSGKDAWTQTVLTLPVDFDISKVLGEYLTFDWEQARENNDIECMEEDSKDSLSASSLRRKLFFHEDTQTSSSLSNECKLPFSSSPSISPLKQTPVKKMASPNKTDSIHFSSSPIINARGYSSTTPPSHFTSPPISPIKTSFRNSPKSSSLIHANKSSSSKQNMSTDEIVPHSLRSILSGSSFAKLYDVSRSENSYMKISADDKLPSTSSTENFTSINDPKMLYNHGDDLQRNSNYQFGVSQDTGYQTGSLQMTNSDSTQISLMFHGSNTISRSSYTCTQSASPDHKQMKDCCHADSNYTEFQYETIQKEHRNCPIEHLDYYFCDNNSTCSALLCKDDFSDAVLSCDPWKYLKASTPTKASQVLYLNNESR